LNAILLQDQKIKGGGTKKKYFLVNNLDLLEYDIETLNVQQVRHADLLKLFMMSEDNIFMSETFVRSKPLNIDTQSTSHVIPLSFNSQIIMKEI